MSKDEPKPNNPLGPYFPSEPPQIPASGRRWLALFVAAVLLILIAAPAIRLLLSILG